MSKKTKTKLRWFHVPTGRPGWSREVLVAREIVVGAVDSFSYGRYGNVLGERTGSLGAISRRRARAIVARRVKSSTSLDRLCAALGRSVWFDAPRGIQ